MQKQNISNPRNRRLEMSFFMILFSFLNQEKARSALKKHRLVRGF